MKYPFLFTAACLLSKPAHGQLSTASRRARRRELIEQSLSFSMAAMKATSPGGKSRKGDMGGQSLVAVIGPSKLGGDATGIASVHYNPDGAFLFSLDVASLPEECEGNICAAQLTTSTSCDGLERMQPHWDAATTIPWPVEFDVTGGALGFSNSAWRVDNGFGPRENEGRAVALVDFTNGSMLGCGVLGRPSWIPRLEASMGAYPNYSGPLVVKGTVTATYRADGTFLFRYDLEGLEAGCVGCGIHIHAGTSCDTHEQVKGHGWNADVVDDLWTKAGGAVYESDEWGNAMGEFNMYNGFSFGKNLGHAVVVHGQSGMRLSCGVLQGFV